MGVDLYIKKGDRLPQFDYAVTPTSVDLTGGTVAFFMRDAQTGTVKINGTAGILTTAKVTPTVSYAWGATDTDTVGEYEAEFVVTIGGKERTFPVNKYINIVVLDDVA